MAYKIDRNHWDYLFWIYPLIILLLLIFAIHRFDKRDSASLSDDDVVVSSKPKV